MSNKNNQIYCQDCGGYVDYCPGHLKSIEKCWKCNGTGEVQCYACSGYGVVSPISPFAQDELGGCSICSKTGKMTCGTCYGSGKQY